MKIFDLKDNKLIVEPQVLTIPEFNVIWTRDKEKDKQVAFDELAYIYHYCDYNSPYSNYPDSKRSVCIIADTIKIKGWKPDKAIEAACTKYLEMSDTAKRRLVRAALNKLDEFAEFFNNNKLTPDNADMCQLIFKNVLNNVSVVDKLEELVEKEKEKTNSRVRGNRDVAMFEH